MAFEIGIPCRFSHSSRSHSSRNRRPSGQGPWPLAVFICPASHLHEPASPGVSELPGTVKAEVGIVRASDDQDRERQALEGHGIETREARLLIPGGLHIAGSHKEARKAPRTVRLDWSAQRPPRRSRGYARRSPPPDRLPPRPLPDAGPNPGNPAFPSLSARPAGIPVPRPPTSFASAEGRSFPGPVRSGLASRSIHPPRCALSEPSRTFKIGEEL